ncbi:hypothetical protein [Dyadobacter sp.]|uniref:hypothetical protein n=1 Tax=Dyadobacter sp. TaxID=1914288 RepID=UPI003F71CBFF
MEQMTKLNDMQRFMLRMFERQLNAKQESEIKQMLSDYFAKQIDDEMDKIWGNSTRH